MFRRLLNRSSLSPSQAFGSYRSSAKQLSPFANQILNFTLSNNSNSFIFPFAAAVGLLAIGSYQNESPFISAEEKNEILNWSATHTARPKQLYYPETVEELEQIVHEYNAKNLKLRVFGSGLSPNAIGFSNESMISLALLDKVISIDKEKMQITVQAGIKVGQVLDVLSEHGMTLQNLASIRDQQIAGFIQAGCHGTGATLPPVDEQVVALTIVSPGTDRMRFSVDENPGILNAFKCGLGALGIVTEVTLQCVPKHKLIETTVVNSIPEVIANHVERLKKHRHLRYMWLPCTNDVVVVTCDPVADSDQSIIVTSKFTQDEKLRPFRELLLSCSPDKKIDEVNSLSWTELRDAIIAINPFDSEHIKRLNQAEAAYWKMNEGVRVDDSTNILGFDCGGQQWVNEVCFKTGTINNPSMKDLNFIFEILQEIEKNNIPAPAPIEQRWTSRSSSLMSAAHSDNPNALFSWVGIIMYLPTSDSKTRSEITNHFQEYVDAVRERSWIKYGALEHWAKIEIPSSEEKLEKTRQRLNANLSIDVFNVMRRIVDPNNILANEVIDKLFPLKNEEDEDGDF